MRKREIEAIAFAFDVYDFHGHGTVDAFYARDLLLSCNLNPSLETINNLGGETEKGRKKLSLTEFNEFTEIIKHYDITSENTIFGV